MNRRSLLTGLKCWSDLRLSALSLVHLRIPTAANATERLLIRLVRPEPGDHLSIRGLISKRHKEGKAPENPDSNISILPTARLVTGDHQRCNENEAREQSQSALTFEISIVGLHCSLAWKYAGQVDGIGKYY
jgi:hypothetical protein